MNNCYFFVLFRITTVTLPSSQEICFNRFYYMYVCISFLQLIYLVYLNNVLNFDLDCNTVNQRASSWGFDYVIT